MNKNLMQVIILATTMLVFTPVLPTVAQPTNYAQQSRLSMVVDSQRLIKVGGVPARISVGNSEIVDVQILPSDDDEDNVLLVANKSGATDVQVWIEGEPQPRLWQVTVVSGVQQAIESTKRLEAPVKATDNKTIISGRASNLLEHRRSTEVAKAAGNEEKIIDSSIINTSGIVQVEVKVVELSRSVMKDVGIDWDSGVARIGGSGTWGAGVSLMPSGLAASGFSLFYDSRNFGFKLRLLEQNGMARTLAEPTLVVLSGQSASFRAGGEIPVPEAGGLGTQSISYKPYGIGLTVTPTVLSAERIALKVAPESSELDYSNAIPVINGEQTTLMPALRVRKADTTVEMGDGESYVISGLVSRQTMANVSKMPFLSDLPIIGSFFRSIKYSQDERELVIVVTPRLIKPIPKGVNLPLPGQDREIQNNVDTAWGYYLIGPSTGEQMPGFSR